MQITDEMVYAALAAYLGEDAVSDGIIMGIANDVLEVALADMRAALETVLQPILAAHDARVTELLLANNWEVERRRAAEKLTELDRQIGKMFLEAVLERVGRELKR